MRRGKTIIVLILTIISICLIYIFFENSKDNTLISSETTNSLESSNLGSSVSTSQIVDRETDGSVNQTIDSDNKNSNASNEVDGLPTTASTSIGLNEKGVSFLSDAWKLKNVESNISIKFNKDGTFESYSENVGEKLNGQYRVLEYNGKIIKIEKEYSGAKPISEEYEIRNRNTLYRTIDGIAEEYERQ